MKNITRLFIIAVIMLFCVGALGDDADVYPYFSAPNVLSLDNEQDMGNLNPSARGNCRQRFMSPLIISYDLFTSGGAEWRIGVDPTVLDINLDDAYNNSPSGDKTITLDDGSFNIHNAALNTIATVNGVDVILTKTDGLTDINDYLRGFYNYITMNDSDSILGGVFGIDNYVVITSDTNVAIVGGIMNNVAINDDVGSDFYGIDNFITQNAGTISNAAEMMRIVIDQNGGTMVSDVYGLHINQDYDGTVGGTTYGIKIDEGSGQDYCIYQNGTAPSYMGGAFKAQGGFESGDTDTAGSYIWWDASGNKFTMNIPAMGADQTITMPVTTPGTYDGQMTFTAANPAVGSWTGDKQHFFGSCRSDTGAIYANAHDSVAYSATDGFVAMRAGTITGLSASTAQINSGNGGELIVYVYVNGVSSGAHINLAPGADVKGYSTYALGTYNFAAGDELQIFLDGLSLLGGTFTNVLVDCEYQTR